MVIEKKEPFKADLISRTDKTSEKPKYLLKIKYSKPGRPLQCKTLGERRARDRELYKIRQARKKADNLEKVKHENKSDLDILALPAKL